MSFINNSIQTQVLKGKFISRKKLAKVREAVNLYFIELVRVQVSSSS